MFFSALVSSEYIIACVLFYYVNIFVTKLFFGLVFTFFYILRWFPTSICSEIWIFYTVCMFTFQNALTTSILSYSSINLIVLKHI